MWDFIDLVPDHRLSFYLVLLVCEYTHIICDSFLTRSRNIQQKSPSKTIIHPMVLTQFYYLQIVFNYKLEKVSIGHGCPRQMPFRKRVYM